jgi:hypothetical protein
MEFRPGLTLAASHCDRGKLADSVLDDYASGKTNFVAARFRKHMLAHDASFDVSDGLALKIECVASTFA